MNSEALQPWYVYLLECADGTFYTGCTNNLDARLEKHNAGKGARYTRQRLPVELLYSEKMDSQSAALKREIAIKQLTRQEKQRLISSSRFSSTPEE